MAFRKRQQMFARLTNREQHNVSRDETLLYILGGIGKCFSVKKPPLKNLNTLLLNLSYS